MASKNPWEGKLFDGGGKRVTRSQAKNRTGTIFTILLLMFAVIVTLVIGFSIYLSIGGSKTGKPSDEFYHEGVPVNIPTDHSTAELTETEESTQRSVTTEVLPGEGAGQIAARSGITIERLYELNPEHLQTGAWYADPGDVVYID